MTDSPLPDDDDRWIVGGWRRSSSEDLLAARQRLGQFRQQLARVREVMLTREVIKRAKDILMVRYTVDESQAFELLRAESNRAHVRLRDVAIHLTQTGILRRPAN